MIGDHTVRVTTDDEGEGDLQENLLVADSWCATYDE